MPDSEKVRYFAQKLRNESEQRVLLSNLNKRSGQIFFLNLRDLKKSFLEQFREQWHNIFTFRKVQLEKFKQKNILARIDPKYRIFQQIAKFVE